MIYSVNQHCKALYVRFWKPKVYVWMGKNKFNVNSVFLCIINHVIQKSGYRTWYQSLSSSIDISQKPKPKSVITISLRISLFMLLASS